MSSEAHHQPPQQRTEVQPSNGWLGVGALVAAAIGVVMVIGFGSFWLGIACAAAALGIQAYRSTKRQPKIGARRIWITAGAFVAGVIGAVLVVVDKIWLSIPIAAVGLGVDAFVRARQRAKVGRKRGFRIAVGAVVSATVGAVIALIGFQLSLALSLLPYAVAQYRRVRRAPTAVRQNVKLLWIHMLDFFIPATVALVVGGIALNMYFDAVSKQFGALSKQFDTHDVGPPPDLVYPVVLPDRLRRGRLPVGSCIARPATKQDPRIHQVPCDSQTAYGRVIKRIRRSSSAPTCPDRTNIVIGSFARPTACVVVLSP
jgi:hypothetical protein